MLRDKAGAPAINADTLSSLCEEYQKNNHIDPALYEKFHVKRGLRNLDGSGVMAGLTRICAVHGYIINDGERIPDDGKLFYRGIDVANIIGSCVDENRFGFEETIWLLMFGQLPDTKQLDDFSTLLAECRALPDGFAEDMIMKAPSPDIMNKLARSVLALYSYDDNPDDISVENMMRQSLYLIAQMPAIMTYAYQVKRGHYYGKSMYFHPSNKSHTLAEFILSSLRSDRAFTDEEAKLLDLCLILHAEHGGGNNSTFTSRVVSSSNTDTYSAIAAAIGSLKGPRHGGANIKVMEMLAHIKRDVKNPVDEGQLYDYIKKLFAKEAGDKSGLVYGMGHAVYTKTDPRAVILKQRARALADERGYGEDFAILETVERLTKQVFQEIKGDAKTVCANVDLYSGLVYKSLEIPEDLFTPIFAVSRTAGWCAHRIEEVTTGGRIIRPAYKSVGGYNDYVKMADRK